MQQYLNLLEDVLKNGEEKTDRTGTGTISLFGAQARYDLREGFLSNHKKVLFNAVVHELLWFINGSTNINENLTQHTPIWDAWANENGDLGPIYGYQWRKWEKYSWDESTNTYSIHYIDQLKNVLQSIQNNPDSRRHIVSAWNVSDIDNMALPPCHSFFQFYVVNGQLDCQLYQRSADMALGVPFNIASYALLLTMVANECNLTPRYFVHTFGDLHIYKNHIDGVKKQLERRPCKRPQLSIAKKPFFDITFNDISLHNYTPQAFIKFPIAV